MYACFVDFRKAFDSVWHGWLLYKLLQIGVGGCFYRLIQNLYSNWVRVKQDVLAIHEEYTRAVF